jgi:hypothetical protein
MVWYFMYFIDNKKPNDDMHRMLNQVGKRVSGTMTHIGQITTGAKHRHKGKHRQERDQRPNDFISV